MDVVKYQNLIVSNNKFDVKFFVNDFSLMLSEIKVSWYRRSFLNMQIEALEINSPLEIELKKHIISETQEINRIVKRHIVGISINKHNDIFINKLEVLKKAKEIGIKIPNSIVTNNKNDLLVFLSENEKIITKNFSQGVFIKYKNSNLASSTTVIDNKILKDIPENFHFTFFQEQIDKLFELRIFFLEKDFYSCAIFSQNNDKTKVDFRNYDFKNPNRTPPFLLPLKMKMKLVRLMKEINVNSGSIDLIVNLRNEFVFLEVNPIGQFSQVSIPCNYNLERKIAKRLADKLKKNKNGFVQY